MQCSVCSFPIPQSRLLAMPNARICVTCLQAAGDVVLTHDHAVRRAIRNSALLADLTEAPILPEKYDTKREQTAMEIISEIQEWEEVDKCDE